MKSAEDMQREKQKLTAPSCIIGIGASAGGLEATAELLEALPVDTGMAFVIIQHLSPDYKSMLNEILSRHTKMPVIQVENGMQIQKNSVYLIPPKYFLMLENGCFSLEEYSEDKKRINHPVDVFFKSLAFQEQRKTVVVVMSGTGSDGTAGVKTVRENGGVVLVQSPETAKFNGMPLSVIQAGVADKILTPSDIAEELTHIAYTMSGVSQNATDLDLLGNVYAILKNRCNIDFTYYKNTTVMRRIQRRMVINHIDSLKNYITFLSANYSECEAMSREMLIGVTSFFRDSESFKCLKDSVIKPLINEAGINEAVRIWVPGCSTGEEAYSIAMLCVESMEELGKAAEIKIFATDLDEKAVAVASVGEYGESITENLSATRLARFFARKNGKYVISRELRKLIVFAQQNILQDPPFGKLDLISCRNMLIYFQSSLQSKVMDTFDIVLKPHGYLFLGSAETVGTESEYFKDFLPGEKIYMHRGEHSKKISHDLSRSMPIKKEYLVSNNKAVIPIQNEEESAVQLEVLEKYLPATFVVDEQNKLVHTFGKCNNYIHVPTGRIELDLYGMLTEDLKIPFSNIVQQTRDEKKSVTYTNITIGGERTAEVVSLTTSVLAGTTGITDSPLISVSVIRAEKYQTPKDAITYNSDIASSRRIIDLENELARTKLKLKGTVSELESVNEELQAANEELLTSNEELQSSNEELQSVNEELYTVNAEYQQKLKEVTTLNNDMAYFLSSVFVGVLFLDKDMKIRRYTSFISDAFNVVEQDIGRSVQCISYNFKNIDLMQTLKEARRTNKSQDYDVISMNGKSYLVRIAPFITQDDKQEGVVLTFIDTTERISAVIDRTSLSNELSYAKAVNRDKDSFLSRISHDMRSPLHEITGLLELTRKVEGMPEEATKNLDEMLGSAQYLLGIINDTVEVGKIQNKGIVIKHNPISVENVLKQVYSIMRFQAENAEILFTEDMSEFDDNIVYMDQNHVMQILVNLIGNAIKYTLPGGKVDFTAKSEMLGQNKVRNLYRISDNGIGIDTAFQKKMFLAFEQEDTESVTQGTGLGLYIVKQLVDAMNGTIQCESRKGCGTTFTVTLEYDVVSQKEYELGEAKQTSSDEKALDGKRILVCDDHIINLKIAERMLKHAGAEVDTALNGKEALECYISEAAYHYDAIFMDIRMPVMDGIQATYAIRNENKADSKHIPIIAVTADALEEDKEKGFAAGITDYATKPIGMQALISIVLKNLPN